MERRRMMPRRSWVLVTATLRRRGLAMQPARLESTVSQPFPLRPGMELAITPDRRLPMGMRFQPGDFADITAATAAEVASALNRTLLEVTATARTDGHLVLRSHRVGLDASLRVEQAPGSLVTLEGAPRGRLSAFVEADAATARIRLFYATADPQAGGTEPAAARTGSRVPLSTGRFPAATSVRFVYPNSRRDACAIRRSATGHGGSHTL